VYLAQRDVNIVDTVCVCAVMSGVCAQSVRPATHWLQSVKSESDCGARREEVGHFVVL